MTRFAQEWCRKNPPRFDPPVLAPLRADVDPSTGRMMHFYEIHERPQSPMVVVPFYDQQVPRMFADFPLRMPLVRTMKMRAVEMRVGNQNNQIRWFNWEPIDPLGDDEKITQLYAARKLYAMSNTVAEYVAQSFGQDNPVHRWAHEMFGAVGAWLGEPPMTRSLPTEDDTRHFYEWWKYAP